jgi:hypothetical protein
MTTSGIALAVKGGWQGETRSDNRSKGEWKAAERGLASL